MDFSRLLSPVLPRILILPHDPSGRAGSNFAIYSFLIILQLPVAGGPIAALGIASLCALGINYAGMRVIVFSRSHPTSSAKIISKRDAADNDRRDKDGQEENARHR